MNWLMAQKLEHREQHIAFEELMQAIRQESERVERRRSAMLAVAQTAAVSLDYSTRLHQ
jgi:transposase